MVESEPSVISKSSSSLVVLDISMRDVGPIRHCPVQVARHSLVRASRIRFAGSRLPSAWADWVSSRRTLTWALLRIRRRPHSLSARPQLTMRLGKVFDCSTRNLSSVLPERCDTCSLKVGFTLNPRGNRNPELMSVFVLRVQVSCAVRPTPRCSMRRLSSRPNWKGNPGRATRLKFWASVLRRQE